MSKVWDKNQRKENGKYLRKWEMNSTWYKDLPERVIITYLNKPNLETVLQRKCDFDETPRSAIKSLNMMSFPFCPIINKIIKYRVSNKRFHCPPHFLIRGMLGNIVIFLEMKLPGQFLHTLCITKYLFCRTSNLDTLSNVQREQEGKWENLVWTSGLMSRTCLCS